MDDASAIAELPDDPQTLKQVIIDLSRQRDEWKQKHDLKELARQQMEIAKLRLEVELLRLKKWYYGPRADRLSTPGRWRRCCWRSRPTWKRGR